MYVAANRHYLSNRFHCGGEQRLGALELFEGKARDFCDDIVNRRFKAGGRRASDVVFDFIERIADRQLRRDLGAGEARGFRCRSEEGLVGRGWVMPCRYRGWPKL